MTIDAARALNMADYIGSLEAETQADITIVNARRPHLIPESLPVSRLVNHAARQDVEAVIVARKLLMRNQHLLTLDRENIFAEATSAFWETAERAGIGDPNQVDPRIWHDIPYRVNAL